MTNLKIVIHDSGLKQKFIAQAIGIDPTLMSRYVSGDREAPDDVLRRVAKFLKVSMAALRGNTASK